MRITKITDDDAASKMSRRTAILGLATVPFVATSLKSTDAFAQGEAHEVQMLNKGEAGTMVYEPGYL